MNAVKSIVVGLQCLSAGVAVAVGGAWNGPDAYLELLICDKVGGVGPVVFTSVVPTPQTEVEAVYTVRNAADAQCLLCSRDNTNNNQYSRYFVFYANIGGSSKVNGKARLDYNTMRTATATITNVVDATCHAAISGAKVSVSVDAEESKEFGYDVSSFTPSTPLRLFASGNGAAGASGEYFSGTLSSLRVWDYDGVVFEYRKSLRADFRPAVVNAVTGLWDRVTCTFLPSGSGTAFAGEGVIERYVEVASNDESFAPEGGYGVFAVNEGTTTFLAPVCGLSEDGRTKAVCRGWKLYRRGAETPFRTSADDGETADSCTIEYAEPVRLVWDLKVEYMVTATAGAGGAVSPAEQWVEKYRTAKVVATPGTGKGLWSWTGGRRVERAETFAEVCNGPMELTAEFEDATTVSDTNGLYAAVSTLQSEIAAGTKTRGILKLISGIYNVARTEEKIEITTPIHIVGAGAAATTVKPKGTGYRVFLLNHEDAYLYGMKITGARSGTKGSGVKVDSAGGTVECCHIYDNESTEWDPVGGGVYMTSSKGLVTHCRIEGNSVAQNTHCTGGGVRMSAGMLENSLVVGNKATAKGDRHGAGIYADGSAVVRNCTIVGNDARGNGGGVCLGGSACLYNCAIYENAAPNDVSDGSPNWYGNASGGYFSCASAVAPNATCLDCPPDFVDSANKNYAILVSSGLRDAGDVSSCVAGFDLDGNERCSAGGAPDIGCYEFDATQLSVGLAVSPEVAFVGDTVSFEPIVLGASDTATRTWTMTDEHGVEVDLPASCENGIALSEPGLYDVTLTVTDGDKSPSFTKSACLYVAPKTNYVDRASTNPKSPYATPETAATSPLDALAYANRIDRSVVLVKDGTYELDKQAELTAGITLVSENGRDKTTLTVKKGTSHRIVYMNHADAEVIGFSLTKGAAGTAYGGGCYIGPKGGTLSDSTVSDCSSTGYEGCGGGVYAASAATVRRCKVLRNKTSDQGGSSAGAGIHMAKGGRVENCLVVGNTSGNRGSGSGIYAAGSCEVVNCTIYNNSNASSSSSISALYLGSSAKAYNCASFGNTAPSDTSVGAPDWYGPSENFVNCAFPAKESYEGFKPNDTCLNVANPAFANPETGDFTLQNASSLRDAGTAEGVDVGETDVDGNPRRSRDTAPDIGCCEYDANQLAVGFSVSPLSAFVGSTFVFTPTIDGAADGCEKEWAIVDSQGVTNKLSEACEGGIELAAAGLYDVMLKVTVGDQVLSETKPAYLYVGPQTNFVDASSTHSVIPYATADSASTNLEAAVDLARKISGTVVYVKDGDYPTKSRISLESQIELVSENGPERTRIYAANGTSHGIVYLNNEFARIKGFVISGGKNTDDYASGCYIGTKGGTVSNCILSNNLNEAYSCKGAGLYIASSKGRASRCRILNNKSNGFYGHGGGAYLSGGVLENSLVCDNTADDDGGGVYAAGGSVVNCTVCNNKANGLCGGVLLSGSAKAWNCATFGNASPNDSSAGSPNWYGPGSSFANCAAPVAPNEATCHEVSDPAFSDVGKRDYTLRTGSPLIDAGTADGVDVGELDLAGDPRRSRDSAPDVGCYEYDKSQLGVGFSVAPDKAFVGGKFVFSAVVEGAEVEKYTKSWTITDQFGNETPLDSACETEGVSVDKPGTYDVRLVVSMGGSDYPLVRQKLIQVAVRTNYVNAASTRTEWPYASPETATTNIAEALAETIPGSTIIVRSGLYRQKGTLKLEKAVRIVGVDGAERTCVRGTGSQRVFYLNDEGAYVSGLAVCNGRSGDDGAGIDIAANGGTVEDCIVTNNVGDGHSGFGGGGVSVSAKGALRRSLVKGNHITVQSGQSDGTGVRVAGGVVESCVIWANYGMGPALAVLGGNSRVLNCTIVANTNSLGVAGVSLGDGSAVVQNCIIRDNVYTGTGTLQFGPNWHDSSEKKITYCCTPVVPYKNTNTVTEEPGYAGNGDFDLPKESPCCQKGNNWDGCKTALDYLGRPRKVRRFVDIGAFENQSKPGMQLFLR